MNIQKHTEGYCPTTRPLTLQGFAYDNDNTDMGLSVAL